MHVCACVCRNSPSPSCCCRRPEVRKRRAPSAINVSAKALRVRPEKLGGAPWIVHPWCMVASPGASGACDLSGYWRPDAPTMPWTVYLHVYVYVHVHCYMYMCMYTFAYTST